MPSCSICKQNGHNRRTCRSGNVQPAATPSVPDAVPSEICQPDNNPSDSKAAPRPLDKKFWVCSACDLPLGNDHRMCICRAFNYSVEAWEKACQEYGRVVHGLS